MISGDFYTLAVNAQISNGPYCYSLNRFNQNSELKLFILFKKKMYKMFIVLKYGHFRPGKVESHFDITRK